MATKHSKRRHVSEMSHEEQITYHFEQYQHYNDPTPAQLTDHILDLIRINEQNLGCGDGKDASRQRTLAILRGMLAEQEGVTK